MCWIARLLRDNRGRSGGLSCGHRTSRPQAPDGLLRSFFVVEVVAGSLAEVARADRRRVGPPGGHARPKMGGAAGHPFALAFVFTDSDGSFGWAKVRPHLPNAAEIGPLLPLRLLMANP
jgi:hypothetical protein